ncbi:MAG: thiamine pyrophosphate-requiring protein [Pigmentiphaga sp.]|uniref:thiamine pyrophosphate-requiring protein n=1 Tax=Pigmentiphaga sp. TaxID=1977564 RepID=UPI0029BD4811|nr:thiamine pyrophosphate-requiring protein [Pigmentiphaga sp.]MDX3904953.1 thiamine pyrophosphate-requiring protein [Pigmentiphaga sp.]
MRQDRADAFPAEGGAVPAQSVGEAYLALLKRRGIDYFYVGAGTDTVSIVEAYARAEESGIDFPTAILCTHENLAVGMAHGYYMVSLRPQAVMLHVSVGAANAVCGVMNAARSQVPMLFTAGRTPLFQEGRRGARTSEIHWAQEMRDQGGMVRELVKWDYELRDGSNMEQVVDRAIGISMAEPRGPVYLTLPREILAQELDGFHPSKPPAIPASPYPDTRAVRELANKLAAAAHPVIVATAAGADPGAVAALVALAERFGIGVAEAKPRHVNFPSSHGLHVGYDMQAVFAGADALLFLETDVPWIPGKTAPRDDAFVAHAGTDPLFGNYPVRSFRSDLTLTASARPLIEALHAALDEAGAAATAAGRRAAIEASARAAREAAGSALQRVLAQDGPITKLFLSYCLNEVRPRDAILVNEYSAIRPQMTFDEPGTYFAHSPAAGLGWGLPAALGAQQAAPDKTVICVLGDGAYIFANPAACHHAAAAQGLPVLTVIFNNARWEAVYRSALSVYPGAHAARYAQAHATGTGPLSSLEPVPDFEKYAEASGGWAERVTQREALIPALRRALEVVANERRHALLNVIGA